MLYNKRFIKVIAIFATYTEVDHRYIYVLVLDNMLT